MPLYRTFPGLPDSPDRPEGPVSPFNFLDPNDTLFGFADDEGPRPLFGDSLGQSAASWRNFPHAASGARTEPGKPYSMVDEVTTTTLSMMNEHADQAELARVDALIRAQKVPGYCILDDCLKYYTTTSAFKRHFYQHVKPFLCRGPDCIQRFANGNDLDRHRSSVHQQRCPGKKRYRCAECPEPVDGKKKVWPRKDNFVSHCKRKHGDKVNATVQRSEIGDEDVHPTEIIGATDVEPAPAQLVVPNYSEDLFSGFSQQFDQDAVQPSVLPSVPEARTVYGCTFPRCRKQFKSARLWKRHELTRHCLAGAWVCLHENDSGRVCRTIHYARDEADNHIRLYHPFDSANNEQLLPYLGQHGNSNFWCGFCNNVVAETDGSKNPAEDRLKHIADHFILGHVVENWTCLVTKCQKGESSTARL